MRKRVKGVPIGRERLFTLANGTYVVQWEPDEVQAVLSGKRFPYRKHQDFGAAVSDFELKQLKFARRISHFNHQYVWLDTLSNAVEPKSEVSALQRTTQTSIRVDLSAVPESVSLDRQPTTETFTDSMDTGQMIRTMMPGRQVLLILQNPNERSALKQILSDLQFEVTLIADGAHALLYLEEHLVDLLITDLHLPDMHAWQMISKLHEIMPYSKTPVLLITDEVKPTMRAFAGEHISRPLSISRLRYHIFKVLQEQPQFDRALREASAKGED